MRATRLLALGLLLTLAVGGCAGTDDDGTKVATAGGGTDPSASAQASGQTDDRDQALKFSQCVRDHGVDWFPDPEFDGNGGVAMKVRPPEGSDRSELEAAMEACKELQPGGGEDRVASPEELENARRMSECMRENGIENFPDPEPNGKLAIDPKKLGVDPESDEFKAAEEACQHLRPGGPRGTAKQEG